MLNQKFGFVNEVLLGGADIPWLTDPWLAKLSVLGVNLWLGFPYMFLVCTGALQSIPGDVHRGGRASTAPARARVQRSIDAAAAAGRGRAAAHRVVRVQLQQLHADLHAHRRRAELPGHAGPVGATDILISMVYSVAFESGAKQYGLASALSIIIFIIVGAISWRRLPPHAHASRRSDDDHHDRAVEARAADPP